jgi:hypothetical protein
MARNSGNVKAKRDERCRHHVEPAEPHAEAACLDDDEDAARDRRDEQVDRDRRDRGPARHEIADEIACADDREAVEPPRADQAPIDSSR